MSRAASARGRTNPLLLIGALVALAIQLFVVQTHIHYEDFAPAAPAAEAQFDSAAGPGEHDGLPGPAPVKDDPSNCPLCQEFAFSSGFLPASAVSVAAPAAIAGFQPSISPRAEPRQTIAHPWFGRGPPDTDARF